ncbi:hypothetical protein [Variovorax sp. KK3]|uniref:type III secretion apparatus assembly protein SctX n=1 Tax=Variovorax sp. KK3 TaxID=1855728 RepID=UPI00097C3973|nr:hypothetical protein [Variovorax sp. KK3]
MNKVLPAPPLRIDKGIDRVLHDRDVPSTLRPAEEVAPPEVAFHSQLDALLAMPNLDDFIDGELRPPIGSALMLTPAYFRQVLDELLMYLPIAAERHPPAARVLGRAARVVDNEVSLRGQESMYRFALRQG